MKRILTPTGVALVLLTLAGLLVYNLNPWASPRVSFLFIAVDTLRADHLSFYGYSRATSPRLAEWAQRGIVYERAYATAPWTLPSFASVVTGQYPIVHRASHLLVPSQGGGEILYRGLTGGAPTLPQILSKAGFKTALFSANAHLSPQFGFDSGCDHVDYSADRPARETTDGALAWFAGVGEQPFFAFVHYNDPHAPFQPHDDYPFDAPLEGGEPLHWKSLSPDLSPALYDGEIAYTDEHIGRLLSHLETASHLSNTWIFFFSDHGEELGDHGSHGHGHTLYNELLHVPLLVIPPRQSEPRRVRDPVSLVDLFPTVLELAQLSGASPSVPGRSLLSRPQPEHRPLFAEGVNLERLNLQRQAEQKAILHQFHKLVYTPVRDEALWFDLAADPRELLPQNSLRDERIQDLLRLLSAHINQPANHLYSEAVTLSSDTVRDLSAIGYLRGGVARIIEVADPAAAAGLLYGAPETAHPMVIDPAELHTNGFELKAGPKNALYKEPGQAAHTAGPYRRLYPGRYVATVEIRQDGGEGELGFIRVVSGGGAVEFSRSTVTAADLPRGQQRRLEIPFSIPADTQIEFAMGFHPPPEIWIGEIRVQYLGK